MDNENTLREALKQAGWLNTKELTELLHSYDLMVAQGSVCNCIKDMESKKIKVRSPNKNGMFCNYTKRVINVSAPETISRIMAMYKRDRREAIQDKAKYIICRNGLEYRNDIIGKIATESTDQKSRSTGELEHSFNSWM